MSDPLEQLRIPPAPVEPDRDFARRLRARVDAALAPTGGPAVSDIVTQPLTTTPGAAAREQRGVVPFIAVSDARGAIDWYVDALDAELRGEPIVMPDGRIGHSELWLAGGAVHVADESPASHVAAPRPGADATVTLGAEVTDVDATIARALARGATLERAAADYPYGRNAVIRDPFHHRWLLSSSPRVERVQNGDVAYASLWIPDVERAATFYGRVLGWEYAKGAVYMGRHVINTSLSQGLWGGVAQSTLFVSHVVDDLAAAIERVRAAGGRAEEPTHREYGDSVDCFDDQGRAFAMLRPRAGTLSARSALRASREGDLEYITMRVADSARARAFYGTVFGWDFTPGRSADAWEVLEPVPPIGMSGGHDDAVTVPAYRVNDIDAAVERVRSAGGTATDPAPQPYGIRAECTDDQSTSFFLAQT